MTMIKVDIAEAIQVLSFLARHPNELLTKEQIIAPGDPRADEGLMNPSLSQAALLQSAIAVDPACARIFRSRLGR